MQRSGKALPEDTQLLRRRSNARDGQAMSNCLQSIAQQEAFQDSKAASAHNDDTNGHRDDSVSHSEDCERYSSPLFSRLNLQRLPCTVLESLLLIAMTSCYIHQTCSADLQDSRRLLCLVPVKTYSMSHMTFLCSDSEDADLERRPSLVSLRQAAEQARATLGIQTTEAASIESGPKQGEESGREKASRSGQVNRSG